jgi:hypothetical protein
MSSDIEAWLQASLGFCSIHHLAHRTYDVLSYPNAMHISMPEL